MASPDGRYHLTYNGEIYNFRDLSRELKTLGHSFKGHSDSEVLLHAYIEWGRACLSRLNGMFAFVIWDQQDQKLFAARDRFGVKPLYLTRIGGRIAFASEIKQFLSQSWIKPDLSRDGLVRYLSTGRQAPQGSTLFNRIETFPPGHFLEYTPTNNFDAPQRWYDLGERIRDQQVSGNAFVSRFQELMESSVLQRLESDVDIGCLLSGGLDSSTIACFAARALSSHTGQRELLTFSSWASDDRIDERRYSRIVAQHLGVRNLEAEIREENFIEEKDRLIRHQEEPFRGTSVFSEWNLYRTIRENSDLKVVLDGQGADEFLVGYYHMLPKFLAELAANGHWLRAAGEFFHIVRRHRDLRAKTLALDSLQLCVPGLIPMLKRALGRPFLPMTMLKPGLAPPALDAGWSRGDFRDYQLDLVTESIYPQLQWQDRSSMAFSIESRQPFLDYRLVELMVAADPVEKVRKGRTKALLRRATGGLLPEEVRQRDDKFGFPGPSETLLGGRIKSEVSRGARQAREALADVLDSAEADRHLNAFDEDGSYWADAWLLYGFHRWSELFSVSL